MGTSHKPSRPRPAARRPRHSPRAHQKLSPPAWRPESNPAAEENQASQRKSAENCSRKPASECLLPTFEKARGETPSTNSGRICVCCRDGRNPSSRASRRLPPWWFPGVSAKRTRPRDLQSTPPRQALPKQGFSRKAKQKPRLSDNERAQLAPPGGAASPVRKPMKANADRYLL